MTREYMVLLWGQWADSHSSGAQSEKIEKASKTDMTPVAIDRENATAEFSGKHGRYQTSLNNCTCVSFARSRQAPCKHMYRLAMELGLTNDEYKSDSSKIVTPDSEKKTLEEAVKNLEALPESAQEAMYFILYRIVGAHDKYAFMPDPTQYDVLSSAGFIERYTGDDAKLEILRSIRPKTVLVDMMQSAGFSEVSAAMKVTELHEMFLSSGLLISELCSDKLPVSMNPDYSAAQRKLYTYLLRIYKTEEYYDPEKKEMVTIQYGYDSDPNDDVNRLLEKYRHTNPSRRTTIIL